jgi:hypothetical protein
VCILKSAEHSLPNSISQRHLISIVQTADIIPNEKDARKKSKDTVDVTAK